MTILPPETLAHPAEDGQLRASAKRLVGMARRSERWTADATYSRGPVGTGSEWAGRIGDCIVIQLSDNEGNAAMGVFLDGKFIAGLTWTWCKTCTGEGFRRPADVPKTKGYRELCDMICEERE